MIELEKVFGKIGEIANEFMSKLDASEYHSVTIEDDQFAFTLEDVMTMSGCDERFEFPLKQLSETPAKVYIAWKKDWAAEEKKVNAIIRRQAQLRKDPAVKEYLKNVGELSNE